MPAVRGARPIVNSEVTEFHNNLKIDSYPTLEEYTNVWREWINYSNSKSLSGLNDFTFADYTQGTSQTFDQFILKHSKDRQIICLSGDIVFFISESRSCSVFSEKSKIWPDSKYS